MAQSPLGRLIGTWELDGRWESSPDGTTWELDFPITYRKVDEAVRPAR